MPLRGADGPGHQSRLGQAEVSWGLRSDGRNHHTRSSSSRTDKRTRPTSSMVSHSASASIGSPALRSSRLQPTRHGSGHYRTYAAGRVAVPTGECRRRTMSCSGRGRPLRDGASPLNSVFGRHTEAETGHCSPAEWGSRRVHSAAFRITGSLITGLRPLAFTGVTNCEPAPVNACKRITSLGTDFRPARIRGARIHSPGTRAYTRPGATPTRTRGAAEQ
jgi:hypothetical protein